MPTVRVIELLMSANLLPCCFFFLFFSSCAPRYHQEPIKPCCETNIFIVTLEAAAVWFEMAEKFNYSRDSCRPDHLCWPLPRLLSASVQWCLLTPPFLYPSNFLFSLLSSQASSSLHSFPGSFTGAFVWRWIISCNRFILSLSYSSRETRSSLRGCSCIRPSRSFSSLWKNHSQSQGSPLDAKVVQLWQQIAQIWSEFALRVCRV